MASDGRARRGRHGVLAAVVAVLVAATVSVGALALTGRLPKGLFGSQAPVTRLSTLPALPPVRDPARPPSPAQVLPTPSGGVPVLPSAALQEVLAGPALGGNPGAVVLDVATGQSLLDQDGEAPRTPASVAKLATAAAVLTTLPADQRLVTRVVEGSPVGQAATPPPGATASTVSSETRVVVLVGAGDARLTRADVGRLAAATARSLTARDPAAGSTSATASMSVSVSVDDSLFSGPALEPGWPSTYVPAGVVSPVSALSVDGGRLRPGSQARSPDPALAAGELFAAGLRRRDITVAEVVERGPAPAGAAVLAEVESPTVAALVERALRDSDNDLAEALLRLVGTGAGQPGSFEGGALAVTAALGALGVPTDGLDLRDGSGLDRASQISPVTVARLLLAAADGSHPELAPVLDGLPVAGFSGTLTLRFRDPAAAGSTGASAAAGLVRAKTGTLTGVSALAGTTSSSGRPVVFAVMSQEVPVPSTLQARADLDRFAALLTNPGD